MFTPQPQRRGWSLTSRAAADKSGSKPSYVRSAGGALFGNREGAAASEVPPPPPPRESLDENGAERVEEGGDVQVWKSFQEAGLLDQASLEKKDRDALIQKIAKLDAELYEYQYNLGLLLIEKKEWTSRYEELKQSLAEVEEILKREQTAHMIALSEVQRREDNLTKALEIEKQCVCDLEKALSDMRAEYAEIKFTSDQKLSDAHALMASVEEKSLEVDSKLRSADAKLAEVSRKSSEIERKMLDVATRESVAHRELASLNAEKELIKDDLDRQREDLRTWERNLRESQERLVESQSLLNQREKKLNDLDKALKQKEKELEVTRDMIEKSNRSSKERVNDLNARLTAFTVKEKEVECKMESLEKKEKDLIARADQLDAKETVVLQELVDKQNMILDSKKREIEVEMEKRKISMDEELKSKFAAADKKAEEINHKEEKTLRGEQALEKKMEKLKDEQKDLDVKSKALKKWEAAMKASEKDLEKKNKQLAEENQKLLISKSQLESERAAVDAEKQFLATEKENLKVIEAERAEHTLLQSRLRQELDECGILKESLDKEREDLRHEKESFEREWDVLDEKKANLSADLKQFNNERVKFEKWRCGEEERLKREQEEARDLIQKDLVDLNLNKEHFEKTMSQERAEVNEMLERERADAARILDLQRHDLEISMQKKLDEMEKQFQKKVTEFNNQKEKDLDHIRSRRENSTFEMQKMNVEQKSFEREKQEFADQKKKLVEDQLEIQNDIDTLRALSKNLKAQREDFIKEREKFLALVDQFKSCENCGVIANELVVASSIQQFCEIDSAGDILLPSLAEGYLNDLLKVNRTEVSRLPESSPSGGSGGRMSWLRSCTGKIFKFSALKRIDDSAGSRSLNHRGILVSPDKERAEPSFGVAADFDVERDFQPEDEVQEMKALDKLDGAEKELETSLGVANASISVRKMESDSGVRDTESEDVHHSTEEQSQHNATKRKVRQTTKRGRPITRTLSVKAVVDDAKAFLKEGSYKTGYTNRELDHSIQEIGESQGDSVQADKRTKVGEKRPLGETSEILAGELEGTQSEARSGSVSLGGRRKRRQTTVPELQTPGRSHYNLRSSTVANTVASTQALSDQTRGTKSTNETLSIDGEVSKGALEKTGRHKMAIEVVSSQKLGKQTREEAYTEIHTETEDNGEVNMGCNNSSADEGKDVQDNHNRAVDDCSADDDGEYDESDDDGEYNESDGSKDGSDSERHNASISKKLWRFFTS